MKKNLGVIALFVTALIWGAAFVAQTLGMKSMDPCFFNAVRSLVGAIALIPIVAIRDLFGGHLPSVWGRECGSDEQRRLLLLGGLCSGCFLAFASTFQQLGLLTTSVAKAGFITALYIIIVPVYGIFSGRFPTGRIILCALVALVGMYLLCCGTGRIHFEKGDTFVLICAFLFALQVVVVDRFAPRVDCVRMSFVQLLTAAVICAVIALIRHESFDFDGIRKAWLPVAWCGVMSSGIAYTLQMVGQKSVHPAIASLIMSLESVFSALFGWIILQQKLNAVEIAGCAIILMAVIFAQHQGQGAKTPGDKKIAQGRK